MPLLPGFYERRQRDLQQQIEQFEQWERERAAKASQNARLAALFAPLPSNVTWYKSAKRRMNELQELEVQAGIEQRRARELQLAKMPNNVGAMELDRMNRGGGLKESAAEKKERQRREQLEKMPKGRGTKPDAKETAKAAAEQKKYIEELRRSGKSIDDLMKKLA
jgi:hypothetical protein